MTKIIKFPTKDVHDWNQIEHEVKTILHDAHASQEMTDEICLNLKEAYKKYNRDLSVSYTLPIPECVSEMEVEKLKFAVNGAFSEIANKIHDLFGEVLFDRLLLEIELYKLRHG